MNRDLVNRLTYHRGRSASGMVHRTYVCDGRLVEQAKRSSSDVCRDAPHPYCSHHFKVTPTRAKVTCQKCLAGGSAWSALVMEAIHTELTEIIGR